MNGRSIRVSDLVVDFLFKLNIDTIFTVTGGGAMFLNDALALNKNIKVICNHHEQASAMAAVGYAKLNNGFSSAIFTTGCGATNAITGLLDAWQDNVRCLFISGQVKRNETSFNSKVPLRQHGVQEANIIPIIKSLTKYSTMVNDPEDILYELEKATFFANSGRPGPIWIDIPLDVQGAYVEQSNLRRFSPSKKASEDFSPKKNDFNYLKAKLIQAKRPIIIAGNGIRLGGAIDDFKNFIELYKIPFVTSYLAIDLLPTKHPLFIGRLGIKGDRAGNFAIQNSDLVLTIGCHLSVSLTGFDYKSFAREANHIVVDIDLNEHKKDTVKIDHFIHAHIKNFFKGIDFKPFCMTADRKNWLNLCQTWKSKWLVLNEKHKRKKNSINMYDFIDKLAHHLHSSAIVVSDAGSSYYVTSQALCIKKSQRYITSGAQADMGFTIPASIGVSLASKGKQVIGITGDGSFQMNIQELQTIIHHKIPIKIVVLNNNGYLSIRSTQNKFFSGRKIGTDSKSGISFPNLKKIAFAYGIPYFKATTLTKLDATLKKVMNKKGPCILEIICPENQEVIPTVSSQKLADGRMVSKPLEDMYPFLSIEDFKKNMIIKPLN
jgi:acetolactate synthase-1/2/3 large subunit